MARGASNIGRPSGEESEHICSERSRLKAGATTHFANRKGGKLGDRLETNRANGGVLGGGKLRRGGYF